MLLTTQKFLEDELAHKAEDKGVKITSDCGNKANVVTYRTYDSEFKLLGSVTIHFEESYASIVNYAGRDAGDSFRYGDGTGNLVREIFKRLKLEGEMVNQPEKEKSLAQAGGGRNKTIEDAFPF